MCNEILDVLDKYLVPTASSAEAAVFYLKMKADYLRYLAEFKADGARKEAAELSLAAYQAAQEKATELPTTNPIRLGLALNFSVFYYEVQVRTGCSGCMHVRCLHRGQIHMHREKAWQGRAWEVPWEPCMSNNNSQVQLVQSKHRGTETKLQMCASP